MNFSPKERRIFEELERRKVTKEDPCDSCDGTGGNDSRVCPDCLGQGILLTRDQYQTILQVSGTPDPFDDSILDQRDLSY